MRLFQSTALLFAVIALAGCSRMLPGPPERVATPTEASTLTVEPPEDDEVAAVAAYRDMWRAFADAAATGDWTSPGLAQYATGDALSGLTQALKAQHDRGWVSRGQPVLSPSVTAAKPADAPVEVRVLDCGDSTNWTRHEAGSGQRVADDPTGRRRIEALVTKQADGAWRVVMYAVSGIGTC